MYVNLHVNFSEFRILVNEYWSCDKLIVTWSGVLEEIFEYYQNLFLLFKGGQDWRIYL